MRKIASIQVPGRPSPSGSRRALPIRRQDGTLSIRLVEGEKQKHWKALASMAAAASVRDTPPTKKAVAIEVRFGFARPKSHYRKNGLRDSAPTVVSSRPDLDKLLRSVLDALTGVVWVDDCQVCSISATKVYGYQGTEIVVYEVNDEQDR